MGGDAQRCPLASVGSCAGVEERSPVRATKCRDQGVSGTQPLTPFPKSLKQFAIGIADEDSIFGVPLHRYRESFARAL
jgi:hypothetical protein